MSRPRVFVNMASSVDGKITTRAREAFSLGTDEDRAMMERLRARADAVLIGAGTLRDEDPPLLIRSPGVQAERRAAKGGAQPLNVLVSASLDFRVEGSRFFECESTERLVYTVGGADPARLRAISARAEVATVPAGPDGRPDLGALLADLHRRGVTDLLLEGGGALNFSMLAAGFVDEVYLTLCPLLIGGVDAPTAFEGHGFLREHLRALTLVSSRANAGGELFLHYRVSEPVPRAA